MELKHKQCLLIQDYYSRFLEVVTLDKTTSRAVIVRIKNIFARNGIPQMVQTDDSTQFTSLEFQKFAKEYGFSHRTSSPQFPQSIGEGSAHSKAGDRVWITNMRCNGKVQTVAEAPRSYMVVTEKGLLCRNRRQLIKVWEGTEEGKIGRQTTTVNKRGTVKISGSSNQNERDEQQDRSYEVGNPEDKRERERDIEI
ncbi:hypothetical protein PR048_010276 [Dryococelus australis]|uniref:Integrase catalytic domain-containing protein n=1 Tax=Dryococelus australis TaxID=614101 RepID=A0ABQ9I2Q9_9NEOP|nr:hypothetical protein PR048_010276 [Dryococelus australis]